MKSKIKTPARPMTLGEQVRDARRVVASWSQEKRNNVVLEGSVDFLYKQKECK